MSQLHHVDDDGPLRCTYCPRDAVGPCASCGRAVCGECCTLTEGGVKVWAVCLECDRTKGRSLSRAWTGLLVWIALVLIGLAVVTGAIIWIVGR